MRVLFLLSQSMESPYGVGRCMPYARELVRRGHEVHVIALHHNLTTSTLRHYEQGSVQIHYVGQMHVRKVGDDTVYFSAARLVWTLLSATLAMIWQAIRLHADVIHIGKPHPQNSFAGLVYSRIPKRRCVILDYDDLEAESNRLGNRWHGTVLRWLETIVPQWVDGVSVHSKYLYERLLELGVEKDKLLRLPSCVDLGRFGFLAQDAIPVSHRKLHHHEILYVGTMSLANHPVNLLLRAFVKVRLRLPHTRLVLVGGGADISYLRLLAEELGIADGCLFAGRVPPDEVLSYYRLATVTVDPVQDDDVAQARWPLKIIESMAAGIPVVTGDIGDRAEMLGEGSAGILVRPGSEEELAAGIIELLMDATLLARLQQGCRAQINNYLPSAVVPGLIEFYGRNCLKSSHQVA